MRIEKINIDRFGRRSNLSLDGLSDQLNVVYGPNGSGKTTTIQFIRWILYGNCDSQSRAYVNNPNGTAIGHATIVQDGLRRKIARQDDGTRQGRLTVDGKTYVDQPAGAPLVSLMGDISQRDFDLIFAPSFDEEPDLSALLQSARTRGMELTSRREPSERVQQIRLRIDNYRRDLDRLPWIGQELAYLVDHRSSLQRRIGQVEDDNRRRRVSIDREYEEIAHQVEDLEAEIVRLRGDWHNKDNDVNARRRELEEAWRVAEEARQEFLRVRRNELVELENNLDRARGMLSEFQRRFERLDRDLRDHELNSGEITSEKNETLCLVESIANQLDDLRAAPLPGQVAPVYRPKHEYRSTIPASAASLDALRGEVGRLCRVLQADRTEDKVEAMSSELKQLRQCESEIEGWTARLVAQRDQLAKEIDEAERFGISLVADNYGENDLKGEALDPNYFIDMPSDLRRVRAVLHSCDGYEPVEPDADELLRRLTAERESMSRDLDTDERRLRQLLDRRRELELILRRVNDHEIASVRREIANLDAKIRSAEERERILREIERLEAELARLRDDIVPSQITSHAVEILRELTRGRYVDVRFADGDSVMVQEASGAIMPHSQLSRGVRDQVYVSFCMALVAAYRRQGIELPLVLNDAFINIDSDQDDALAAVLSGFARQGHQVILFTRHRHVADLFRPHAARYLELGTTVVSPVETVDQVRFRPSAAEDVGRTTQRPVCDSRRPVSDVSLPARPVSRERHISQRGVVSFQRGRGAQRNRSRYHNLVEPTLTTPQAIETESPMVRRGVSNVLAGETPLDATGVVDLETARRLADLGVLTVDDFLRSSPEVVDRELGVDGAASLRPVRRWRYELALRSMIPDLGVEDAQVLVSCGVSDVRALADTTLETLSDLVQRFVASDEYHRAGRSAYRINVLALQHWINAARAIYSARPHTTPDDPSRDYPPFERHPVRPNYDSDHDTEYDNDYTREYSRDFGGANEPRSPRGTTYRSPQSYSLAGDDDVPGDPPVHDRQLDAAPPAEAGAGSNAFDHSTSRANSLTSRSAPIITGNTGLTAKAELTPQPRSSTSVGPVSRRSRTSTSSSASQRTSARRSSRSSTASRTSRGSEATRASTRTSRKAGSSQRELRFYLDRSAPVVDAPSIGAKTAQKLRSVGVVTVDDLLRAGASQVAKKLGDKRMSAETIAAWQAQATLACRIPQLRSHDAQILVACGVKTPEQLAGSAVDQLWSVVGPFAKTTEGKRIIRGGKAPDRAEVSDWIDWSCSARPLRSA